MPWLSTMSDHMRRDTSSWLDGRHNYLLSNIYQIFGYKICKKGLVICSIIALIVSVISVSNIDQNLGSDYIMTTQFAKIIYNLYSRLGRKEGYIWIFLNRTFPSICSPRSAIDPHSWNNIKHEGSLTILFVQIITILTVKLKLFYSTIW